MIVSFACRKTEALFVRHVAPAQWRAVARVALRKLIYLHAATKPEDLLVPPGNMLEKLKGDRRHQYSIRVNQRWRVCFRFEDGHAHDVEIVDYH